MNCISSNIDSLPNKLNEIELFLHKEKIDIAAFVETTPKNCSSKEIKNLKFEIEGFNCISDPYGRGVCIYVNNNFEIIDRCFELEKLFSPCIFCKIKTSNNDFFTIGVVYRSPNLSDLENNKFSHLIEVVTKKYFNNSEKLVLLGDFNFPNICWDSETCSKTNIDTEKLFLESLQSTYFTQFIKSPTHHRGLQTPTLIDLIISNDPDFILNTIHMPPFGKSHHSVLHFYLNIDSSHPNLNHSVKYCMKKADYKGMKQYFSIIDWDSILDSSLSVNEWWEIIVTHLNEAKDKFIPKIKNKLNNINKPSNSARHFPVPDSLQNKLRLKRTAFKTFKKFPTQINYNTYAKYRNQVKKEARKAKINKEVSVARNAKTNPKEFYKYINCKLKPKDNIPNLVKDDSTLTVNDYEKCKVLNSFFSSVFTNEDTSNIPDFEYKTNASASDAIIEIKEMEEVLSKLNISKSPGPDGIAPVMLKNLASELAYPFYILFNKTLTDGQIPSAWKEAEVRPIFKKGSKTVPGNYRPVSLTSVVCKIFEKFIKTELLNHLISKDLLSIHQYGFCIGRSCVTQLLNTMNDWFSQLDKNTPVDAVYLDFRKAFDTVPHTRLINKLRAYGVKGKLLDWIKDFLSHRLQFVSINGESSEKVEVTSGVPQGSVLGPILFVYYINDLPLSVECSIKIFADDTKAYLPINSLSDKYLLQESINKLVDWSEKWQLKFNSEKCKILHIGKNNPKYEYSITENGVAKILNETSSEKDLGVFVDSLLNFEDQVDYVTKKARRLSGLIVRYITYKSSSIMIPLFKALIRPVLEYGNTVWCPSKRIQIDQLESIQRHFTKCIIGMGGLQYTERLEALKLFSLEYRRLRGDLIEMFKMTHKIYDPLTLTSLFSFNYNITRSNNLKLNKPRINTKTFQNFFTNRIINVWNQLPMDIVSADSLNVFKNKIDSHFKEHIYQINFKISLT